MVVLLLSSYVYYLSGCLPFRLVGVGLITRQPESWWSAGITEGGCQIVHGVCIVRLSSFPAFDSKQAQLITPEKVWCLDVHDYIGWSFVRFIKGKETHRFALVCMARIATHCIPRA